MPGHTKSLEFVRFPSFRGNDNDMTQQCLAIVIAVVGKLLLFSPSMIMIALPSINVDVNRIISSDDNRFPSTHTQDVLFDYFPNELLTFSI